MSDPLISGYEYAATLQLRTPLCALLNDGERVNCRTQPANPHGDEHGCWIPVAKTWRELGIDFDEMPDGTVASDIGPVVRIPYRNFLISLKLICADDERSIAELIESAKAILRMPEHAAYCRRHGGQGAVIDSLFPPVVSRIPGVTKAVAAALWKARLRTVERISKAEDAKLLALPGVGKKSLVAIRAFCDQYRGDFQAERLTHD